MNIFSYEFFDNSIKSLNFQSFEDVSKAYSLSEDIRSRISAIHDVLTLQGLDSSLAKELKNEEAGFKDLQFKLQKKKEENSDLIYSLLTTSLDIQLNLGDNATIAKSLNVAEIYSEEVKTSSPRGLPNLGNSCYLNATMQALIGNTAIKEAIMSRKWAGFEVMKEEAFKTADNKGYFGLKELFLFWEETGDFRANAYEGILYSNNPDEQEFIEDIYKDFSLAKRFQSTLQDFVMHLDLSKNPNDMKASAEALRAALFSTGVFGENITDQQDSATLVELILQKVGIAMPYETIREVPSQMIHKLKIENLGILPVPIKKGGEKEPIYVQNLLHNLFQTTPIHDEKNAWEVDGHYHADYDETIRLGNKPPPQIVLQFKRFEGDQHKRVKITDDLILPKDHILDLSQGFNLLPNTVSYRVTGAIHHDGDIGGGHYRSFLDKGDKWYETDDTSIKQRDNVDKELAESYILILERV